jgi:hypothetical protein
METESCRTAELDSPENLKNQSREVIAERIGKIVFVVILLCAALGFLGPGPLTSRQSTSPDRALRVDHYLIERVHAPAELCIQLNDPFEANGFIELAISRTFTDDVSIESITPEPENVEIRQARLVYRFRASNLSGDARVIFRYQHDKFGWLRYQVGIENGPTVDVSQFVCP